MLLNLIRMHDETSNVIMNMPEPIVNCECRVTRGGFREAAGVFKDYLQRSDEY